MHFGAIIVGCCGVRKYVHIVLSGLLCGKEKDTYLHMFCLDSNTKSEKQYVNVLFRYIVQLLM